MDNTVGSRGFVAFTARKRQTLWVQKKQLEILTGSILGDAYVAPQGKIQIEHSIKHLPYLMWKYQELASIAYPSLPARVQHRIAHIGKTYESRRFWIRQFFRPLRSQFYKDKQKIFPRNLKLTPLALAVWYMDDGHYEKLKHRSILATDGFDRESVQRIQNALRHQFSIESSIRKSGKLVFTKDNRERLFDMIRPYIIPSMSYKIC